MIMKFWVKIKHENCLFLKFQTKIMWIISTYNMIMLRRAKKRNAVAVLRQNSPMGGPVLQFQFRVLQIVKTTWTFWLSQVSDLWNPQTTKLARYRKAPKPDPWHQNLISQVLGPFIGPRNWVLVSGIEM